MFNASETVAWDIDTSDANTPDFFSDDVSVARTVKKNRRDIFRQNILEFNVFFSPLFRIALLPRFLKELINFTIGVKRQIQARIFNLGKRSAPILRSRAGSRS